MSTDIYFGNRTEKMLVKQILSISGWGDTKGNYNYYKTYVDEGYFSGASNSTYNYEILVPSTKNFYVRFVGSLQIGKSNTATGSGYGFAELTAPTLRSTDADYESKLAEIKNSGWNYSIRESSTGTYVSSYKVIVKLNDEKNTWRKVNKTETILIPSWFDKIYLRAAGKDGVSSSFDLKCALVE